VDGRVLKLARQVGDTVRPGEPLIEIDSPDLGQAPGRCGKGACRRGAQAREPRPGRGPLRQPVCRPARISRQPARTRRSPPPSSTAPNCGCATSTRWARSRDRSSSSSPLPGVITERNVTVGQQVQAASGPAARHRHPARLWLVLDVPESRCRIGCGRGCRSTSGSTDPRPDIPGEPVAHRAAGRSRDPPRPGPGHLRQFGPCPAPRDVRPCDPDRGPAHATRIPSSSLLQFGAADSSS
jgi:biotin carboxyl carrier protein